MAKRRISISSTDLSWRFFDAMRDDAVFPRGVSIAVVPDPEVGWRAVVAGRNRKMSAPARKRFKAIEERLRQTFKLSRD